MQKILLLMLVFSIFFTSPVYAQQESPQKTTIKPREQLGVIIFSGLGGGILGLSTLSFYARPQDNLKNIAFGFATGIIIGTIITTFKAAKNSYNQPLPYSLQPNKVESLLLTKINLQQTDRDWIQRNDRIQFNIMSLQF